LHILQRTFRNTGVVIVDREIATDEVRAVTVAVRR
jgi:hypothetical protein